MLYFFFLSTVDEIYDVEKIIKYRVQRNGVRYLTSWRGYEDPTWEPATSFVNPTDVLEEFFIDYINDRFQIMIFKQGNVDVYSGGRHSCF